MKNGIPISPPLHAGIGVGLATSAAFVALNHYFKEKRGQAVGLSMAGTAVGMLILPQLVRILLEAFEFPGAVLVLSALALHAAAGSMLLQPVKRHLKEVPVDVELSVCVPSAAAPTLSTPAAHQLYHFPEETDGELPEMTNLLRFDANKKMRKNFSELAISSMNRPGGSGAQLSGGRHAARMPRNLSVVAMTKAAMSGGLLPVGGIGGGGGGGDPSDPATAVRRRRASVVSHLSMLDFTGSNVHVHLNVSSGAF